MKHEVVIDGVTYVPAGTVEGAVTQSAALAVPQRVALEKADPSVPAFVVAGNTVSLRFGVTIVLGEDGDAERLAPPMVGSDVRMPDLAIGDYRIVCDLNGALRAVRRDDPIGTATLAIIGGFYFAPGGNAKERSGGDETPVINPHSVWDLNFKPACDDPSGMVLVDDGQAPRFWCDIWPLAQDHSLGTSRFGATIADGGSPPEGHRKLDYETAKTVLAGHGKQLLSFDEFRAAAHGVTEATSFGSDPRECRLDAPRTSRFGIMQATGNMSIWGHDGDVGGPNRACRFGGSWGDGEYAGSRCAFVVTFAVYSGGWISARGRSDHLQLA